MKSKRRVNNNISHWRDLMIREEVGSHLWNYYKFTIEHEIMRMKRRAKNQAKNQKQFKKKYGFVKVI